MKKNYELMLLLNPNFTDQVDAFLSKITDEIVDKKGEVLEIKQLGKRQLAYPIQNMTFANYIHLNIKIESNVLKTLENMFKFDENIFRYLTVKIAQK